MEPNQKNKGLLISSTLVSGEKESPVQIINDLDQFVVLKPGHAVGIATEIDDIIPVSEDDESDGSKQADSVTKTTPPECSLSESEVAESDSRKQADLVTPMIPQECDLLWDTKYLSTDHKFDIGILPSSSIPVVATILISQKDLKEVPKVKPLVEDQIPDHLKEMFQKSIPALTPNQVYEWGKVLIAFEDFFAKHDLDLQCLKGIKHHIYIADHPIIRQRI